MDEELYQRHNRQHSDNGRVAWTRPTRGHKSASGNDYSTAKQLPNYLRQFNNIPIKGTRPKISDEQIKIKQIEHKLKELENNKSSSNKEINNLINYNNAILPPYSPPQGVKEKYIKKPVDVHNKAKGDEIFGIDSSRKKLGLKRGGDRYNCDSSDEEYPKTIRSSQHSKNSTINNIQAKNGTIPMQKYSIQQSQEEIPMPINNSFKDMKSILAHEINRGEMKQKMDLEDLRYAIDLGEDEKMRNAGKGAYDNEGVDYGQFRKSLPGKLDDLPKIIESKIREYELKKQGATLEKEHKRKKLLNRYQEESHSHMNLPLVLNHIPYKQEIETDNDSFEETLQEHKRNELLMQEHLDQERILREKLMKQQELKDQLIKEQGELLKKRVELKQKKIYIKIPKVKKKKKKVKKKITENTSPPVIVQNPNQSNMKYNDLGEYMFN